MPRIIEANWYEYCHYYDIAFQEDTEQEADFILAAGRKYCDFPITRVFEPGCGTGRIVRELAARGLHVTGFDLSLAAIDYLRDKLKERGLQADVFQGDMTEFGLPGTYDIAYCFCNTFRHLLTEEAARRHLECVAAALRPGGLYLLGLHIFPPDADLEDTERWTQTDGHTRVTTTFRVLSTNLQARQEILRTNLCATSPEETVRVRSDYPMRIYNAGQFRSLLASVPTLQLCDVYDFWYEIDHPLELDDEISDTVAVLRKVNLPGVGKQPKYG